MAYVAGLKNFTYPNCKNPYAPTTSPVKVVAAAANGEVGMVAVNALATAEAGVTVPGITVNYVHKGGVGSVDVPVE